MSWVSLAQGVYYVLGAAHYLRGFVRDSDDYARPDDGGKRIELDPAPGAADAVGLIGASAGLYETVRVPRQTWETKVPIELHFRRARVIDPAWYEDITLWREQASEHPRWQRALARDPLVLSRVAALPQHVEFYVEIKWFDLEGRDAGLGAPTQFRFYMDNSFVENSMVEFRARNNPNQDGVVAVRADRSGVQEAGPEQHSQPGDSDHSWPRDRGQPMCFGVIQPRDMGLTALNYFGLGGAIANSFVRYADTIDLGFTATLYPRVETTSMDELALFFDPLAPWRLHTKISSVDADLSQNIEYDF